MFLKFIFNQDIVIKLIIHKVNKINISEYWSVKNVLLTVESAQKYMQKIFFKLISNIIIMLLYIILCSLYTEKEIYSIQLIQIS